MNSLRGKTDKDGDIALVGCLISGLCLMIDGPTIVHSCGVKSWIRLHSICWKATHVMVPSNRLHSESSDAFDNASDELAASNRPVPLPKRPVSPKGMFQQFSWGTSSRYDICRLQICRNVMPSHVFRHLMNFRDSV